MSRKRFSSRAVRAAQWRMRSDVDDVGENDVR